MVVLMVTNQDQADSVLYGPNGAVTGMLIISQSFCCASDSIVHLCHTLKACRYQNLRVKGRTTIGGSLRSHSATKHKSYGNQ